MDGLTFFDIFERIIVCLTPIILAIIGLAQVKSQKKVDDYAKSQQELSKARAELAERDKAELEEHFTKLETQLDGFESKINDLDKKVEHLSKLDKQLAGLIDISSANFGLCQSLSNVMSSIGDALDSTESINSVDLKKQLSKHRQKEQELTERIFKTIY